MNIKKTLKDYWMLLIVIPLSFCIPMAFATALAIGHGETPLLSINQLFAWLIIAVIVCLCFGVYTAYKVFRSKE